MSVSNSPPTNGKVRPITCWGTPILHRPVRELTSSDFNTTELDTLIADMFATMYAANGGGLAANQVDVDLKVFVYDNADPSGARSWGVVCNPIIEAVDIQHGRDGKHQNQRHQPPQATQSLTEGCLSYPGILASVSRPLSLLVRGVDHHGSALQINATGALAQILLHETDHLNGIVYGDHVARKVREQMDKRYEILQAKKTYPEDWPVTKAEQSWEL